MSINAPRDQNRIPALLGTSNADNITPVKVWADPTTHRLLVDASGVSGAGIASHIQVDQFTSTNGQTTFNSSQTVIKTIYLSLNGAIQTPSTDYSETPTAAVLSSGIPSGIAVIWVYVF